jgi:hypothetical protein
LANALAREKGLETKLAASAKALKDAQTQLAAIEAKCKKDVTATEARATKAEKALGEADQKQSQHDQSVVQCIDVFSTLFGSKCDLPFPIFFFCIVANYDILTLQQSKLDRSIGFMQTEPKTLFWMPLVSWGPIAGMPQMCCSKLDMC